MSNVQNPAVAGKDTDPSIASPTNPLAEILLMMRDLKRRFDAMEQRFEWLDRDCLKAIKAASLPVPEHLIEERPTEPAPPPHVPSIAFRSDGEVLLSVVYVQGANLAALADRERWEGIVLTEAERCDFLDALSDGADDAAAHVGGRIIKRSKKSAPEGSGSDGDE
jgi:hypothetical protein